ncbi:MAG: ABC transporter permease [Acidobacteriota bacterium]
MMIRENVKEAANSLLHSRQRTFLALLGIIIGIGSFIAMVSVGTIVRNESLSQFKELGTDILTVTKDIQPEPGRDQRRREVEEARFRLDDVLALPSQCPSIQDVAPTSAIYGTMTCEGKRFTSHGLGVTESFFRIFKVPVEDGRSISDLDAYMPFCVISHEKAEEIGSAGISSIVGKEVQFKERVFTVIGVLSEVPRSKMRPREINEGILVPLTTSLRFPLRPEIKTITARVAPESTNQAASEQLVQYFEKKNRTLMVRVQSAEDVMEKMEKQMRLFTLLLGAIGSIALVVGGVGVMNVMLVSVSERKREIGIRRALGAQQSDIQAQFLMESVMLSIVGGTAGMGVGLGAAYSICVFNQWEFFVSLLAVALGVGVSCAVGLFFGFYPARQASKLNPITALRTD